jgi:hypothetical protein
MLLRIRIRGPDYFPSWIPGSKKHRIPKNNPQDRNTAKKERYRYHDCRRMCFGSVDNTMIRNGNRQIRIGYWPGKQTVGK